MIFYLSVILELYLIVNLCWESWNWQKKELSTSFYIVTVILSVILGVTTYFYARGFQIWQGVVLSLGLMLLGFLPDINTMYTKKHFNMIAHAARFLWHVLLLLLLFFSVWKS